jgi:hypothetical protein
VPEKRDVQQIEFKTEAEAKAARAKIGSAPAMKTCAAQRGLKPDQMSLGTLAEEELPDAERAKAIFALPLNEVSQPIKTGFGGLPWSASPRSRRALQAAGGCEGRHSQEPDRPACRQQAGGRGQCLYRGPFHRR